MADVGEALLLSNHQDSNLDSLLFKLILSGDRSSDCPQHTLRNLLHRPRGENFETFLEPDTLGVQVHRPVHLGVPGVVRGGLVGGEDQGPAVVDGQLKCEIIC